jgi:hypothetical protein
MDLAAMYGTPGGPAQEDQEKVAQAELFIKLAHEVGLDLSQYSDEQLSQWWEQTFPKEAGADAAPAADASAAAPATSEEKLAAAQAEFAAAQEFKEKVAEMDYLGRLMAHAYINELTKIGEAMDKTAAMPPQLAAALGKGGNGEKKEEGNGAKEEKKEEKKEEEPKEASVAGPAIWKEGSANVDQLAAELAVEKAAAANWDKDEAITRINAVITLGGPGESEKAASASDLNGAVEVRSLEFLEAAGYQVYWPQQEQTPGA